MRTLGRRIARLIRARLDPELVDLDVPSPTGRQLAEQRVREREDRPQALRGADLVGDRLEPALEVAVQRVVLLGLEVRPVRATKRAWRRLR
jgi:hypothetical protein